LKIVRLHDLKLRELEPLIQSSIEEGFNFLSRLKDDWLKGKNRFDKKNEELCQVEIEGKVVAVGGVNNNPFENEGKVGRLRRFYVHPDHRRKGVGRFLLNHLITRHKHNFDKFTLRTDSVEACEFYESMGFKKFSTNDSTHEFLIKKNIKNDK